jgi:gliding motility-associated-like protein
VAGVAGGSYTATLIDNYGCTTSQPINVTQPGLLVLLVNPNPTICFGQTTQLNASGNNGTPGYSYTWSPTAFIGGGPHTVSPTTTTMYTVAVSDMNGCSPTPTVITVNVTPQLTIISNSITLCHGINGILTPTMTSPGKGGPYSFIWNPSAATTSVISVTGSAPSVPTIVNYSLTVVDGCSPNSTAVFTVNTNPLPAIDFAPVIPGCSPLMVTLTGTSIGSGSDIFTWSDNRNGVLGSGNFLPVTYINSGKYTVTLDVVNPVTTCSNTITKTDHIEVYPQPIASFYADPQPAGILDPTINFFNTTVGANGYYWNFGDPAAINGSNNSTDVNPSHEYTYTGLYSVNLVATSLKGCTDTARINVEISPEFALYIPNTFTPDGNGLNDVFQPMGVGIDEENYRMDIFDRWGENIFSSNNFRKGWDGTVKGSSTIAEQGVYTYKVMAKDIMGNKHPMVGHVTILKQN